MVASAYIPRLAKVSHSATVRYSILKQKLNVFKPSNGRDILLRQVSSRNGIVICPSHTHSNAV